MDRLPSELLDAICLCLDTESLRTARLTNNIFENPAARILFRKIYFASLEDSIRKLHEICNHPDLRHYVQTIVYIVNLIDRSYQDFNHWSHSVLEDRRNQIQGGLVRYYNRLLELRLQEDEVITTDRDYDALCLAIKRCPNLKGFKSYQRFETLSHMHDHEEDESLAIVTRLQRETLLKFPFYSFRWPIDLGDQSAHYPLLTRQKFHSIKAIGSVGATCHIQDLDMNAIPWCRRRNGLKIHSCCCHHEDTYTQAFQHIHKARLCFMMGGLQHTTVARPLLRQSFEFF